MMAVNAWELYWVEVRPFKVVADVLDVSPNRLSRLWSHWGYPRRRPGPRRIRRRLTDADIVRIHELCQVESQAEVARRLGVSRQRVHQILRSK